MICVTFNNHDSRRVNDASFFHQPHKFVIRGFIKDAVDKYVATCADGGRCGFEFGGVHSDAHASSMALIDNRFDDPCRLFKTYIRAANEP
jgi:hypothetical protein